MRSAERFHDDALQRITTKGLMFVVNYADNFGGAGIGNDVSLTIVAVTEPICASLFFAGALGLMGRRHRAKGPKIIR